MNTTLTIIISFLSLTMSVLTLVLRGGLWGGTTSENVSTLIKEIEKLRLWRHKIGDEPYSAVFNLYLRQEKELDKLAQRIEDMQYFAGPDRRRK